MVKDIAKRVRELRKSMKLTQSQFAELVNLSEDSIGKIERGVSIPTIDTLNKIVGGLKVSLSELLGEVKKDIKSQNKILEDLIKYLRTKSTEEIKLIHEITIKILERNK